LAFEGNIRMLMGLSTRMVENLRCVLPGTLIL
jgi:hypothetical protein